MTKYELRPESELNGPIRGAMGSYFEKFQALAAMMAEQPATAAYVKAEMGRLLAAMPPAEKDRLLRAVRSEYSPAQRRSVHARMKRDFPGLR